MDNQETVTPEYLAGFAKYLHDLAEAGDWDETLKQIVDHLEGEPELFTESIMLQVARELPWVFPKLLDPDFTQYWDFMFDGGPDSKGSAFIAGLTPEILTIVGEKHAFDVGGLLHVLESEGYDEHWLNSVFTPQAVADLFRNYKENLLWQNLPEDLFRLAQAVYKKEQKKEKQK